MSEISPHNPEREALDYDAIALATMQSSGPEELIAYRPGGGIDVARFIETGETTLVEYKVGGDTLAFEKEVSELLVYETYDSWVAFTGPIAKGAEQVEHHLNSSRYSEHDPTFDGLRTKPIEKATQVADVLSAGEQIVPCARGCENGEHTGACRCTSGGSSYTDKDGHTVKEREAGTPKSDCEDCSGSGECKFTCYDCKGAGQTIVNPLVTIINNQTGEEIGFRLNVPEMLADGNAELLIQEERRRSRDAERELRLTIDISEYIDSLASDVGFDIKSGQFITYWGGQPLEAWGTTFGYLHNHLATSVELPESFESEDAFYSAALRALQIRAASAFRKDTYGLDLHKASEHQVQEHGKLFDIDFNTDLTVSKFGLRLDKPNSAHQALQESIAVLAKYGYRLGFTYTGIATGETGPALYMLDDAGNLVAELESGYDRSLVLQRACEKIKKADQEGWFNR